MPGFRSSGLQDIKQKDVRTHGRLNVDTRAPGNQDIKTKILFVAVVLILTD